MATCPDCQRPLNADGRCAVCGIEELAVRTHVRPEHDGASIELDDGSLPPMERVAGRYVVRKKIGSGSFGQVYEAFDEVLARRIAIKRIRLDHLAEGEELQELRARSLREAQVAAQLRHPNIVAIHDVIATDSECLIIMELIEGRTLDETLRDRGRLSLSETREIVFQIGSALDYAHEHKVVHRDIKPANIMLDPSGRVQVMDFGIAKAEASGQLTATGLVVGTPNYMSPEQARGEALDGRSDLFSLTCILYECLSGGRPFSGASVTATLLKVVSDPPAPLDYGSLGLDPRLGEVIGIGLDKDHTARYPSAASLVAAVDDIAQDASAQAATVVGVADDVGSPPPGSRFTKTDRSPQEQDPLSGSRPLTIRRSQKTSSPGDRRLALGVFGAVAVILVMLGLGVRLFDSQLDPPSVEANASPGSADATDEINAEGPLDVGQDSTHAASRASERGAASGAPESPRRSSEKPLTSTPVVASPADRDGSPPTRQAPGPSSVSVEPPVQDNTVGVGEPQRPPAAGRDSDSTGRAELRGEAQVVQVLRRIHQRQQEFKTRRGAYASSGELHRMLADAGRRQRRPRGNDWTALGYHFQLEATPNNYRLEAVPIPSSRESARSFFLDETGIVRGADHGGLPANSADPPVR